MVILEKLGAEFSLLPKKKACLLLITQRVL